MRLYFAELEDKKAKERIFDVKLQGETVLSGFDVVKESEASHKAVVREFRDVRVNNNLEIELVPKGKNPPSMNPVRNKTSTSNGVNELPILCGVEVMHTN